MIRILVVDDNAVVHRGLRCLLADEPNLRFAAEAADGRDALSQLAEALAVDIVMADFDMPGMEGPEPPRQVVRQYPQSQVNIVTLHRQIKYRREAFNAGAPGYLLKGNDEEELFKGIRAV